MVFVVENARARYLEGVDIIRLVARGGRALVEDLGPRKEGVKGKKKFFASYSYDT